MSIRQLILALYEAGCIKFSVEGFKLKSGKYSPIYIDLRPLVSYPDLLREVGVHLGEKAKQIGCDRLAGIPFAGLPLAVVASQASGIPMIYARPPKEHGTMASIEGILLQNDQVLVVDDVISDGASKIDGAKPFIEAGGYVSDVLVMVDRETGGAETIHMHGFNLHSLTTMTNLTSVLHEEGKIDEGMIKRVADFLVEARKHLSYRAHLPSLRLQDSGLIPAVSQAFLILESY